MTPSRAGAVLVSAACASALCALAAHAAVVTLSSVRLTAGTDTPPVLYASSLALNNAGATAGKAETNDTVVTVYAQQVLQSTLCSGWTSNATSSRSLSTVTFTINNNTGATGNDVFSVTTVPTTCSGGFKYGTVDLGSPNYVTGTVTFSGSTIGLTQTATSTTLSFTLGTKGGAGTVGTVTSGVAAVYTPTATITNTSGTAIGANLAQTVASVQW